MVKIALQLKVTFENIEELKPSRPKFKWYLRFKCNNCGEETEKWNYVTLSETIPTGKGNAVHHYESKCKLCGRENSMTILDDSIAPYSAEDQEDFKTVVIFDCRGLEPCDFSAREGWIAKAANGGKEFTDVDLSEGEWVEYCDITNQPVGIYEIEFRFERVKVQT